MDYSVLQSLCRDRERLLKKLGPALKHAGPTDPDRNATNQRRRAIAKRLKRELAANADALAALAMEHYHAGPL